MKKYLPLLILLPLLAGCYERALTAAKRALPMADRAQLIKQAEMGDVEAQYELGKNYCCGIGIYYDNAEALHWWCEAAKQGQADAMFEIGKMFENTRGIQGSAVPTDPVRAYTFYMLAEARYQKDAGFFRKQLGKKMTAVQRMDAEAAASDWPRIPCELPSTVRVPKTQTTSKGVESHAPAVRQAK